MELCKIIDIFKTENYRYVHKKDLYEVIKNFEPDIDKNIPKTQLIEKANIYLTDDTIDIFNEIAEFGINVKNIMELTNLSNYYANKLLKTNNIEPKAKIKYGSDKYVFLYDPILVANATIPEVKTIAIPDFTDDNIAEALYIINKSAKVSRDTKNKTSNRNVRMAAITRKYNLYDLKDLVLNNAIENGKAVYIGRHISTAGENPFSLDCYRYGEYTFHLPSSQNHLSDPVNNVINEMIAAEKTRKTSMTYRQALELLKEYRKKEKLHRIEPWHLELQEMREEDELYKD